MILVEERLKELFDTLPAIQGASDSFKPTFGFGIQEDCLKVLDAKKKEKHYPLVWLETPFTKTGKEHKFSFPLKLILAEKSDGVMSNEERFEKTFKPMLVPLYDNVLKALNRSGFTKILNEDRNKSTNYFNYSVSDGGKKATYGPVIWDAIKFECELQMDSCPMRTITF